MRSHAFLTHYYKPFTIEQIPHGLFVAHYPEMRTNLLTPAQLLSVPCPTCGVLAGEGCVLHSGGPRSSPHVDRKLAAADAVERKRG